MPSKLEEKCDAITDPKKCIGEIYDEQGNLAGHCHWIKYPISPERSHCEFWRHYDG